MSKGLDKLVAENVMLWTEFYYDGNDTYTYYKLEGDEDFRQHDGYFKPSRSKASAMDLLLEFVESEFKVEIFQDHEFGKPKVEWFEVNITRYDDSNGTARCPTLPLAICLASLMAIRQVPIEKIEQLMKTDYPNTEYTLKRPPSSKPCLCCLTQSSTR